MALASTPLRIEQGGRWGEEKNVSTHTRGNSPRAGNPASVPGRVESSLRPRISHSLSVAKRVTYTSPTQCCRDDAYDMRKTALETYLKGRFKVWVLVASRSEPSEHGTVSEARTGVGGGGGFLCKLNRRELTSLFLDRSSRQSVAAF